MASDAPLACPRCGETKHLGLSETYFATHPLRSEFADGRLTVVATNALGTSCPSEYFNAGSSDYSLHCGSCTHDWDLPAGIDIDWD